jgi:hypothetical protein
MLRRLIVYGILFDLLIIISLIPVVQDPAKITIKQIVFLGVLETLIAFFPGFVFFVSTRLLSSPPSLKALLSYAVVCKFVFCIPTIICTSLYLWGENTVVLAIRGGLGLAASFALPVLCPYLVSTSTRKRPLVSILSLVLLVAARTGIAALLGVWNPNPVFFERLEGFSLLFDPVSFEISHDKLTSAMPTDWDISKIYESQSNIVKSIHIQNGRITINLSQIQYNSSNIDLETDRLNTYVASLETTLPVDKDVVFLTTKEFVRLIRVNMTALRAVSDAARVPFPNTNQDAIALLSSVTRTTKEVAALIKAQKDMTSFVASQVIPRYRLRRYLLSVW